MSEFIRGCYWIGLAITAFATAIKEPRRPLIDGYLIVMGLVAMHYFWLVAK